MGRRLAPSSGAAEEPTRDKSIRPCNGNNWLQTKSMRECALFLSLLVLLVGVALELSSHAPPILAANCAQAPPRARTQSRATRFKIAALATKLDHWLQCNRLNLLSGRPEGSAHSAAQQQQQERTPAPARASASADADQRPGPRRPRALCRAHFDGHLCWPQASPGEVVRLPCPVLNYLPIGEERGPEVLAQQQRFRDRPAQHQGQSLKSVIDAIQNVSGDSNQTQAITLAQVQSIAPTGSRHQSVTVANDEQGARESQAMATPLQFVKMSSSDQQTGE